MLWSVEWSASLTGYRVLVCNRCRIVRKFHAESLSGESPDDVRRHAREKAVELALEFRVPLVNIIEGACGLASGWAADGEAAGNSVVYVA